MYHLFANSLFSSHNATNTYDIEDVGAETLEKL